ncbi:Probable ADP-ribosylation factor GTPase-activating protein AGD14 [Linum grandiflorum]
MMGSKKEEERNEKIIRGLLKLPPNRRCINCNSLGPQYVCTNFWTFVCMTCSGIHREFTHRVKSVSMSKFTFQEVEALQTGGNQRAREIYLREWDLERQRLPASSNVDRVREFIKHVYVDKKYAGTKTADKPPRDLQRIGSYEDESRRASSYHSFSQSPPYDFQYEERRYGKQGAVLRRPGSDRGISVGKMSSFIYSPTRSTDRTSEDRFANEGSVSRLSDFSVSSGGDLVRPGSGFESPNFQKGSGGNSPSPQTLGNAPQGAPHQIVHSSPEADFRRESNHTAQPQRTMSLGGKGIPAVNPLSHRSNSLPTLFDDFPEPEQAVVHHKENGRMPIPPTSASHDNFGLAKPPALPPSNHSGNAPIDLFQLPSSSGPPLDFFNGSQPQPPSQSTDKLPQTFQPSTLDLFSGFDQNQPVATADKISCEPAIPENGGWATFDNMQPVASSTAGTNNPAPSFTANNTGLAATQLGQVPSLNTQVEFQAFQNLGAEKTSSVLDPWHGGLQNLSLSPSFIYVQTWNAFDNSSALFPVEHMQQFSEPKLPAYNPLAALDMHKDGIGSDTYFQPSAPNSSSHPMHPMMVCNSRLHELHHIRNLVLNWFLSFFPFQEQQEQTVSQAPPSRSTNPFELPYDSDLEPDNMVMSGYAPIIFDLRFKACILIFYHTLGSHVYETHLPIILQFLDMASLQSALPNDHLSSAFVVDASHSWFPQDPVMNYMPNAALQGKNLVPNPRHIISSNPGPFFPTGGLPYTPGSAPSSPLGGNPFA